MSSLEFTNRGTRTSFVCVNSMMVYFFQAMDAAQLADDLKTQLELAQKKLHDFQDEIVESRVTREKEMFNFKRAEVYSPCIILQYVPSGVCSLCIEVRVGFNYINFFTVSWLTLFCPFTWVSA